MSVYSTPCYQFFDEETSSNEDSVYITPESSFTDSDFTRCSPVSYDSCDWKSEGTHEADSALEASEICRKRKLVSESIFDKENIGINNRSIAYEGSNAGTPLKCVTTLFNSDLLTNGLRFGKLGERNAIPELCAKRNVVPHITKTLEGKFAVAKTTRYNLFRKMKLLQKLGTDHEILKQKGISANAASILVRDSKANYGSISSHDSNEQKQSEVSPKKKLFNFSGRTFSFSMIKRCRLVNLKRLFVRPVTSVHSCCAKYLQKFQRRRYQSLYPVDDDTSHNVPNPEIIRQNSVGKFECDLFLADKARTTTSPTQNVSELLLTVISRLSAVENELKELKSIVQESKYDGCSMSCFRAPPPPPLPPPPPPLPSNLNNHSSTPKRKADLTTPENQQLAKRPSRIQEQRGQFSVTVEDLKNVKLRKIGNPVTKKISLERNLIKEPVSLPSSTRTSVLRYRRNLAVDRKELSEIAVELFSSRNRGIGETTLTCTPRTTSNISLDSSIYEQTPKRTKCRSSIFRRMKELNESPS